MKRRVIFMSAAAVLMWITAAMRGTHGSEHRRAGGNTDRGGGADGGDVSGKDQGHPDKRESGVRVDGGGRQSAVRGQP